MTSTNIFSGIQGERNSSRVLRPPGGGQTDVLGVNTGAPASPKKAPPKPVHVEEPKPKTPTVNNEKPKMETPAAVNVPNRSRVPPGGFSSGGFW
ncbi:hypothetical protein Zmor_017129 [Zophobas morio]|uniref:Microtubule-associated protein Jupiter n=1 Tax=Zophobas morio TaxID=2755281 RepID=A0AA38MC48_9CUCU|nr:hypothetical protein Zmor_017129 [Zophobas morio]